MKGPIASFFTASYQTGILYAHSLQKQSKLKARGLMLCLKDMRIDGQMSGVMHIVCVQWLLATIFGNNLREKKTHCAIDEDPQKLSSNGLQPLAIVQLSQDDLILQDVAFQDNLEQPLIHGHHFICSEKKRFCISH